MSVAERPPRQRKLVAPREDRGLLVDPPARDIPARIDRNLALRREVYAEVDLQGRTLGELTASARRQLCDAAVAYTRTYRDICVTTCQPERPVLLAGHQPTLFHPGVWSKNFALAELAARNDATAVNLLIDGDAVKSLEVAVPGGTPQRPTLTSLPLDVGRVDGMPFEEYRLADLQAFRAFGQRATEQICELVGDPLIHDYWSLAQQRAEETGRLGLSLAQSRHQLESYWGCATLELPQSKVCEFDAFRHFAAHVLAHLPRFWDLHNAAVRAYRRRHRVRSMAHPVPDLAADGRYLEAPFWIWDAEDRRRRPLFVAQEDGELRLTDRGKLDLRLSASCEGELDLACEQLAALSARGIKIRTRALLTTLFARLLLGDLFVHGIGGAKYDALTDVLLRRFCGLVPPEFVTLSATLHLPIERPAATRDDVREVEQALRDLVYHPETALDADQLSADAELRRQVAEKRHWIHTEQTLENARRRCQAIRQANETMQPHLADRRARLLARRDFLLSALRNERILGSREYAFCLYSGRQLQDFLLDYLPAHV
ncbi:MAG: hypothetical protein DWQ35_08795 [Planctomycetota bacterium]|nr:MAG: hypothetical protein DWQ35_08795 [Planctomycetota bacterium]